MRFNKTKLIKVIVASLSTLYVTSLLTREASLGTSLIKIYVSSFQHAMPSVRKKFQFKKSESALHNNYEERKYPLILYWDNLRRKSIYGPGETSKIGKCSVTYNRSRILEASAVLFHYTTIDIRDLPWRHHRDPGQIYIWSTRENPSVVELSRINLFAFNNFFNWTMTYRRDADVTDSYGYRGDVLQIVSRGKSAINDVIKTKKKLAIWLVSQCNHTFGARLRMEFAVQLIKEGLSLTTYGKCFNNQHQLPRSNPRLVAKVIKEHKFYFAFENAIHCKDYITEKFWKNSLLNDAVPVVWGPTKEDILSVAPLDSFVFVEDFESPRKLAKYLKFLDSNDDEYRKYFRWREDESMTDKKMIKMINSQYPELNVQKKPKNVCEKILHNKETKVIKSLTKEFMENNRVECTGVP